MIAAEPTFRARLLNAALRAADASGLDLRALMQHAQVDMRAVMSDERVLHSVAERLYSAAAAAAHDPAYGLCIGAATDALDHGELSVLLLVSSSGEELLEMQRRYAVFWHDSLSVAWQRDDVQLRVLLTFQGVTVSRVVEDAILAAIVLRTRAVAGRYWAPLEVWLTHAEPRDTAPYQAYFRCVVRFGMPRQAIVVPSAYFDIKVPGSGLNGFLAQAVRAQLEAVRPSTDIVEQVQRTLRNASEGSAWTSDAVAKQLGLSRKTLERRVAESGSSFRAIVNDLRFELAQLALQSEHKLETIAMQLGFSDLRSFTRAFKRWTGMTPSAFKAHKSSTRT